MENIRYSKIVESDISNCEIINGVVLDFELPLEAQILGIECLNNVNIVVYEIALELKNKEIGETSTNIKGKYTFVKP